MKAVTMKPRTESQQRKLNALFNRLERDDKRTQATRRKIEKFLNAERLKFMPLSTDD